MVFIISGLSGTGKTTICKYIEDNFKFTYLNDFKIFSKNNILINRLEDKNKISKKYHKIIFEEIEKYKNENIVLDLEYSISPEDYHLYLGDNNKFKIVYLGFISLKVETLFSLFRSSNSNSDKSDDLLLKDIEFYKKESNTYFNSCKKYNLTFIDVNKNRKEVLGEVVKLIK